MHIVIKALLACILIPLLLTACGGGGGGGNSSDDAPDPEPTPSPGPTYTLSGTITASGSQAVDSDTNNRNNLRLAVSNDSTSQAQEVGNPVTIGGYVNLPGTGVDGRSQVQGDVEDFYRVELLAGQTITMLVADFEQADADLYLYNERGIPVDFSIAEGNIESLVIQQDGTYFVNASAFAGATNYIIAIGAPFDPAVATAGNYEIVPWQAVVRYHDPQQAAGSVNALGGLGMVQRAGGRGRSRLMTMRNSQQYRLQRQQRLGKATQKLSGISDADLRARLETLLTIKSLRKDPAIRYAEPNYRIRTMATPNDEAFPLQWHYPLIGLPDAWETTTGDPDVVVAVIDTGVLADHPDLAGQLVDGYDFVRNPDSALDGDGIDPNPQDPGSNFGAGSSSFHGTHTSGTVAARGDNQLGVAGSAYDSRVMPLRALGAGGEGTSYDVEQAILFAAGLSNDSDTVPQKKADIINLSLGGAPFSQRTQDIFNQVRAAGVIVVAAAGNQASSVPSYPASYEGVISVSAVDAQRRLAGYSNVGRHIDVAAPGGDNSVDLNGDGYPDGVLSTGGAFNGAGVNFAYPFLNGTSMASPHVAGVLALMKSVNPALTPADIDALLQDGRLSDDLGAPGRDNEFGYGIINAQRSVLAALESTGSTPADNPRLVASTGTLNFGNSSNDLELVLRNGGKGSLNITSLSTSESWLQIAASDVDPAGLGNYRVVVDRGNLPVGIYAASIDAQSSVNSLTVQVIMSVGNTDVGADVGVIYILLYDPVLNEPVAQEESAGNNAEYSFSFSNIAPGKYEIIAGSDADNDLLICDAGEACGSWLTIDQPILIDLEGDLDDLDFPVEYQVALPRLNNEQSQGERNNTSRGISRKAAP